MEPYKKKPCVEGRYYGRLLPRNGPHSSKSFKARHESILLLSSASVASRTAMSFLDERPHQKSRRFWTLGVARSVRRHRKRRTCRRGASRATGMRKGRCVSWCVQAEECFRPLNRSEPSRAFCGSRGNSSTSLSVHERGFLPQETPPVPTGSLWL